MKVSECVKVVSTVFHEYCADWVRKLGFLKVRISYLIDNLISTKFIGQICDCANPTKNERTLLFDSSQKILYNHLNIMSVTSNF